MPLTRLGELHVLNALRAVGGVPADGTLKLAYVGLFIAPTPAFDKALLMAAITPATYTGYARLKFAAAPPVPYIGNDELYTVDGDELEFRPTDGVTPNTILGWFLASALAAGDLWGLFHFNSSYPLEDATRKLALRPTFKLPDVELAFGQPLI